MSQINLVGLSATLGNVFQLQPLARVEVAPGDTVSGKFSCNFESGQFWGAFRHSLQVRLSAFYVPYRLVWSSFPAFLSGDVADVPLSVNAWPAVGEMLAGNSDLGRRAYRLIYNRFFGDEAVAGSGGWYSNVDGNDVTMKRLRTFDQFVGMGTLSADLKSVVYQAPVTGVNAAVTVNDLLRSMRQQRWENSATQGDKYVDLLRRMGVQLDWRIQHAPEWLGSKDFYIKPRMTRATAGEDIGKGSTRWEQDDLVFDMPRRFFAEHGIIFLTAAVRSPLLIRGVGANAAKWVTVPLDVNAKVLDDFWLHADYASTQQPFTIDNALSLNFPYMQRYGAWMTQQFGAEANVDLWPWWHYTAMNTAGSALYIDQGNIQKKTSVVDNGLGTADYSVQTRVSLLKRSSVTITT